MALWKLNSQANPLGFPRPLFTPKSHVRQHLDPAVLGGGCLELRGNVSMRQEN